MSRLLRFTSPRSVRSFSSWFSFQQYHENLRKHRELEDKLRQERIFLWRETRLEHFNQRASAASLKGERFFYVDQAPCQTLGELGCALPEGYGIHDDESCYNDTKIEAKIAIQRSPLLRAIITQWGPEDRRD